MATRSTDQEPPQPEENTTPRAGKPTKKSSQTASGAKESVGNAKTRRADQQSELSASRAAALAMQQVMELAGRDPESVTSLERTERGWRVGVEVVETRRIPDSADILAVYDTELDEAGELISYRRSQRYSRGHSQG